MPTVGAAMMAIGALPLAYLAGSLPFGVMVGRLRGVDVLAAGSRNPGATNVGRLCGRPWGVLVFMLDAGKGFLAAGPLPRLVLYAGDVPVDSLAASLLAPLCAVAVFAGHSWSPLLGFRGGKGVAAGAGALLALAPVALAAGLLAWAAVLLIGRYMSLASMTGALATAGVCALRSWRAGRLAQDWPVWGLTALLALLVIVRHRANIVRLLRGSELRLGASRPAGETGSGEIGK